MSLLFIIVVSIVPYFCVKEMESSGIVLMNEVFYVIF